MTTFSPRRGVTLIELLVVMGIMAALTAIAVGTYFTAVSGQQSATTEATLGKLDAKLMTRWSAVIEQARTDTIPPQILSFAGNNRERARIIWAYMKLKNEFPTTKTEATTPITVNGYSLQPRAVFGAGNLATGKNNEEESGACFMNSLLQTGVGGSVVQLDGLQQQIGIAAAGKIFRDGWGQPIAFVRFGFASEVNTGSGANRDPLDPNQLLTKVEGSWNGTASADSFWNIMKANHLASVTLPATYSAVKWSPMLISSGSNKEWGANLYGGDDNSDDNLLSYRIRVGQKGN